MFPPTHYLYISITSRLGESVCTLPHAPHAGHGPVYVPTPLPPLTTEYRRAELVRYELHKGLRRQAPLEEKLSTTDLKKKTKKKKKTK